MYTKCFVMIVLLMLIIVGGLYKFMFQGDVSQGADGRATIHLTAPERDLVLAEMRAFLISVQQITSGISDGDMKQVTDSARKVGKAAQGEMPGTLMAKLPLAFKQLGSDTHSKFDQLAMDAEDMEDSQHALKQLSTLMQNCVSCHSAYRIDMSGN